MFRFFLQTDFIFRSQEYTWSHLLEEEGMNVQGNAKSTSSHNGRYRIMKTNQAECVLLLDEILVDTYKDLDQNSELVSAAISDDGLIAISLRTDVSGIVRIYKDDFQSFVQNDVWEAGYGTGLSLTPSGSKIAIGSPEENLVYTYDLEPEGVIKRDSRMSIFGPNESGGFGSKVGLSEKGTSIAIATPNAEMEDIAVGAIYVYVLIDGGWEPLTSVLYGSSNILNLGIGGVSLDDSRGIVTAQDSTLGQKHTFLVSIGLCSFTSCTPKLGP